MNVPCRQCSTPVDPFAPVCPVCGAANPAQRQGAPPGVGGAAMHAGPGRVVVTDIDIPMGRLVLLILKVMIASIPAYLILAIIFLMFFGLLGAMFGALIPGLFSAAGGGAGY